MPDAHHHHLLTSLVLGVVFGAIFLVTLAVIIYLVRTFRKRSVTFAPRRLDDAPKGDATNLVDLADSDDQHEAALFAPTVGQHVIHSRAATMLIPFTLPLLKACKSLSHRLMSSVLDGAAGPDPAAVLHPRAGSIAAVVAAAKPIGPLVDELTKSMYPPVDIAHFSVAAKELFHAMDALIVVTRAKCHPDRLAWLPRIEAETHAHYDTLLARIARYQFMVDVAQRES